VTAPERSVLAPAAVIDRIVVQRPSRDRILVALFAGAAVLLRAPNLGRAYWVDEGISIGIASHPLHEIPTLLRTDDGSPPLFYVVLHVWIRVFGTSPVATHFLPFLVALAVTPLAYWGGREIFDRRAGLWAAALTATNPFLGWYSTETRMYPLVCAFGIVGLTLTVRAVRGRRRLDAVGAVLAGAALLYTHNWGIYLVAVTAATVAIWAWWHRDRSLAVATVWCGAAIGVLYLPWLPGFISQARLTAAPWAVQPHIGDLFADPASVLGGTLNFLVAPLLAVGWWLARPATGPRERRAADFLIGVGVLAAVIGWLAAQAQPSWTVRYLAALLPPLVLGVAGALAPSRRGRQAMLAVCVLLAGWSIIGSALPNANAKYAKSNVAAVAAAATPYLRPGDVVVVTQTEQVAVLAHYLPKGLTYITPTGVVSDPYVVDWSNIVHRLQTANPCTAVAPELAGLQQGTHVLEILPLHAVGAQGSGWYKAVNTQVADIEFMVASEPSLTLAQSLDEGISPEPYSAVTGQLFVKTNAPTTCELPPS
jgi:mannosyltransferase